MAGPRSLLLLLALLLCVAVSSSLASPVMPRASANGSRASAADLAAYLKGHSTIRAKHGAKALTWNNTLAAAAQKWADGCQFKHSGGTLGRFGENLAAGSAPFSIAQGIKAWTDEAPQFNAKDPKPSHFTQVVWKGTTQVGCAVQTCTGIFPPQFPAAQFYVCEYSPPGNVIGQFGKNVQA